MKVDSPKSNPVVYNNQKKPRMDVQTEEERAVDVSKYGELTEDQKSFLINLEKNNSIDPLKQSQNMGQEQFMYLLLTQMTHQNPLEPMKDQQFISQMAQFSSLESLKSLNNKMQSFDEGVSEIKDLIKINTLSASSVKADKKLDAILKELQEISKGLKQKAVKEKYD